MYGRWLTSLFSRCISAPLHVSAALFLHSLHSFRRAKPGGRRSRKERSERRVSRPQGETGGEPKAEERLRDEGSTEPRGDTSGRRPRGRLTRNRRPEERRSYGHDVALSLHMPFTYLGAEERSDEVERGKGTEGDIIDDRGSGSLFLPSLHSPHSPLTYGRRPPARREW